MHKAPQPRGGHREPRAQRSFWSPGTQASSSLPRAGPTGSRVSKTRVALSPYVWVLPLTPWYWLENVLDLLLG